MIYGYVSCNKNGSPEALEDEEQKEKILKHYPSATIVFEEYEHPKKRPLLRQTIEEMLGRDTLVVSSLDRLCGTIREALEITDIAAKKGIRINILNLGMIDRTPAGRNVVSILRAMLEFERTMMLERTRSGKAIAKESSDFKEGRPPKFTDEEIKKALKMLETKTYKQVEEELGISKSTLIRAKRKELND